MIKQENIAELLHTTELYIELATSPQGMDVYIEDDGSVSTMEANSWYENEDRLYFGKTLGEIDAAGWEIEEVEDEDQDDVMYRAMDRLFETEQEAFLAVLDESGLPLEISDELIRAAEDAAEMAEQDAESRAAAEY